jgi:hypothetical protein
MYKNGSESAEQDKKQYWKAHVGAWEQSGIGQSAYCRREELNIEVFGYWKRKLSRQASDLTFVPVAVKTTYTPRNQPGAALRLLIGNNYGIEVGDGFHPDTLRSVLHVLGCRV